MRAGSSRLRMVMTAGGLLAGACGSSPSSPGGPSTTAFVFTLTTGGVQPKNLNIGLGDRVLFVNQDTQSHSIGSDPHPDHTDCPSINQVGFLQPGQTHETGNFVVARVCGFHDHDDPLNQKLWGTITTK